MRKTILTLFLCSLLCGCSTDIPQSDEFMTECSILNEQREEFNFRIYKIECPEGIYRCFHGDYSLNCKLIQEQTNEK